MGFEVTIAEANDLGVLYDYEIVVIADDSGSMCASAGPGATRWSELQETLSLIMELGTCFDESGIDLFFLNRGTIENVKGMNDPNFLGAFQRGPSGGTPLSDTVGRVVNKLDGEKGCLLFILTDGEPNEGAQAFIKTIEDLVKKRSTSKTVKVQVMACTDDDSAVGYLNDLDAALEEVDVTDDYRSEQKEVLAAGKVAKFTRGDWVMKAMLGPVSTKFDKWDETKE